MTGHELILVTVVVLTLLWTAGGAWVVARLLRRPSSSQAVLLTGRVDPVTGAAAPRVIPPGGRGLSIPLLEAVVPLELRPVRLSAKAGPWLLEAAVAIDLDHAQTAARRLGVGSAAEAKPLIEQVLVPLASTCPDEVTLRDAAEPPLQRLGLKLESLRLR